MSLHELREALSQDWRADARCLGADTDVFFPEKGEPGDSAKEMCAECPVREPCLEEGLRVSLDGIWGGMNRRERMALARRQGLIPRPFPTEKDMVSRRCSQPRCKKKTQNTWCDYHAVVLKGLVA